MSRTKALEKVKLTRFDDLFGGKEVEPAVEAGEVKQIPISELHEFHNHPFQIRSDEELEEMIESVRQHGVLVPGIVRPRKEGGYEIIAGHTRRHVCELLGIDTMPVFVKDLDDDEASLIMVDSNIQRENILPSEKAKAYKIKYDAMKMRKRGGICTGMSQNLIDVQRNRSTKTMVSNSEFMLLLDQGTMDKEAVEDLFDISAEQLACVNGADPGMGLIRFGDKIVPFDNTMKKDSELYQLFNTNFHEIAGVMR